MQKLPDSWLHIDRELGSSSRGRIHYGLVAGVPIYAQDFNGIHCIGSAGATTYVVGEELDGEPDSFVLFRLDQISPRDPVIVHKAASAAALFEWIIDNGGAPLPKETLSEVVSAEWLQEAFRRIDEYKNRPPEPHYAVHTYAVVRFKTIGAAPYEGESIKDFAERISNSVAASLGHLDVRGVAPEGCDVEQIEYAEEISSVLVDEIVPDDEDPTGEKTIMHWFDDRMEPNNGNGTDPARYIALQNAFDDLLMIVKTASARIRRCDYTMAGSDLIGAIRKYQPDFLEKSA